VAGGGARRAFTLIESMATVVVLAIMGSLTSFLILDAVDGYTDASTSAQLHGELSVALDRAVREIRMIELDGTASGLAPNITDVTPTSIFWTDSDLDSYLLQLSTTDLILQIDNGLPAVLAANVSAFSVTTYDEDNSQLAATLTGDSCDPIRRVELEVTLQRGGVSESLRTRTFIRSTMSLGD
jgi:prepilin-type N-terminal cleavage/methylation domain-containing protein